MKIGYVVIQIFDVTKKIFLFAMQISGVAIQAIEFWNRNLWVWSIGRATPILLFKNSPNAKIKSDNIIIKKNKFIQENHIFYMVD